MFCVNRWMAGVICTLAGSLAYPATDAALQQCRSDQAGDIAIANCLSLQHEETEVALAGIEESLGNLLGTTYRNNSIGGTLTEFWSRSRSQPSAEPGKTGRQVIAIIDGVATSVDESVLYQDEATPPPEPPPESPELNPLAIFDTERDHFRSYRDNRCSWIARVYEPAETAWREISCRVEMNRERIDDLREQLNRRLEQKTRGYVVRGFLQRQRDLSFQPCGSTQIWPVSANGELSRTLADRLQTLAGDSNAAVYAELSGSRLRSGGGAGLAVTGIIQLRAAVAGDCELDTSASTLSVSQVLPVDRQMAASAANVPEVVAADPKPIATSKAPLDKPAPSTSASPAPAENTKAKESVDSGSATVAGPGTLANASDDLMYGYFQGWAAACETEGKRLCRAFSDSEPSGDNTWQLQINPSGDGQYDIVLLPRTQNVRIGRDVGIFVDQKPVADRRLSPAETRLKVSGGVVLKRAENAQVLLRELRRGTRVMLRWIDYSQVQTDVTFTLWGLSRALEFRPDP